LWKTGGKSRTRRFFAAVRPGNFAPATDYCPFPGRTLYSGRDIASGEEDHLGSGLKPAIAATAATIGAMLRGAGLRPTRQRSALAAILFGKGDRHVTAELLYDEARQANVPVSLATIYNTLHQFSAAGLLRAISVDSNRTYFDTNTGDHHHFYLEASDEVIDMPENFIRVENLPEPPEGYEISKVDVIVRVRAAGRGR